ncbi:MAG: AIR carboxylase family protein [Candidatus Sericytochromatia bacterium]|nr:AIR carboxylase family protein [Candidatus Tanganyikabacteria bacterium]
MATSNLLSKPAASPAALDHALASGLADCFLPELGAMYRGKVRDCYVAGDRRIMITSDRVSAFDRVFAETIPFKGLVLNLLAAHFLRHASRIVPTHLLDVPDPNVTVARQLAGIPLEMVVRGYLAGSAWRDYQEGVFARKYGFELPAGLGLNAKLARPIVTPTEKCHDGHDRPVDPAEAARLAGGAAIWETLCDHALRLFEQGTALAAERGLILVDTKYEFGLDGDEIVLMDEVHTPDSSRFWYAASYAADPARPEQLSKEFLRDWLREKGFSGEGPVPALPPEVRLEIARRYLDLYRTLTGAEPPLPAAPEDPRARIVRNLRAAGILEGTLVAFLMGSASDRDVAARAQKTLAELGVATREWVVSAHKVPDKVFKLVADLNGSAQPLVLITIAGRSNGLSGVTAANSVHPVIALPAFSDKADYLINVHSSLQMPSETPAVTAIDPSNAALAAARMLALADPELKARLAARLGAVRDAFEV